MKTRFLIDAIVRQTGKLVIQVATSGGVRAPLAHIGEQVFLELARELENQSVSRKVAADMFGVALRTFQRRTQRLRESVGVRDRTLWEAIHNFLAETPGVNREQILRRFRFDDERLVRGVLHDLTESGLVIVMGTGQNSHYRIAADSQHRPHQDEGDPVSLETLVWSTIYREGPADRDTLVMRGLQPLSLDATLERLVAQGSVQVSGTDEQPLYSAEKLYLPSAGKNAGWEGAMIDHLEALIRTLCTRLAHAEQQIEDTRTGGCTYTLEMWHGHPMEEEVVNSLARFRREQTEMRERLDAYNQANPPDANGSYAPLRVITYAGQCVSDADSRPSNSIKPRQPDPEEARPAQTSADATPGK